jgi:hypothetical protein
MHKDSAARQSWSDDHYIGMVLTLRNLSSRLFLAT